MYQLCLSITFFMTKPEHQEVQGALASQPSAQDALARLFLRAALPRLAATMAGVSAALDGSSSADAASLQQQTFKLVSAFGVVFATSALLPAMRRHFDTHGSGSALRCAVQVLNAVPLRCPSGVDADVFSKLLRGAMDLTALLAGTAEPIGDHAETAAEQRAGAWQLVRLLPRLAALLRAAAADAQQRPGLARACLPQCCVITHVAGLGCGQSGIRSVAEASKWAVATEAALGLLPLLDELDAGCDGPLSGSPPGVTESYAAIMAFNIVCSLLFGGLFSAKMLWSGPDKQHQAEEAARTGAFNALVRLHARVCRLAFWLPTRSSPGLLPDGRLTLLQATLRALFLVMWDISCCAEVGAVEGVERR
jgi:hypothetical protein